MGLVFGKGVGLGTGDTLGEDAAAVAKRVERLEYGIEHVVDVLLHDTGLVVVDGSDVALDDIGVGSAEEVRSTIAHGIRVDDVVSIDIVSSGADGVGAADIGRDVGHDGETGGRSTTEPVRSEGLVAEDGAHSIARKLGGSSIGEELENESNFGEGGEDASHVEFKVLVFLLVLVESVEFELLEDLVVNDGVVPFWPAVAVAADVVEESVE